MNKTEKVIENLKLIKATIEWEYPLDYQLEIDEAIELIEKLDKQVKTKSIPHTYENCHNITCKDKSYKQGRIDALDELVERFNIAVKDMEDSSIIEKTVMNAVIVGSLIGLVRNLANELKEQN